MAPRTRAAPFLAGAWVTIILVLPLTQCGPSRFDGLTSSPERLPAPQQLSPTSTSLVTTLTPSLRWRLPPGVTEARVELCDSPECAAPMIVDVAGESLALPPSPLPPVREFDFVPNSWRVRSRAGTEVGRPSPQWTFFAFKGASLGDTFWNGPPDLNGDGTPEFIVGSANEGRVYIYTMAAAVFDDACSLPEIPVTRIVERPGTAFGTIVRFGGDIDGDGFGDVIVAAPTASAEPGHVYVIPGARGGALVRNALYDVTSGTAGAFGYAIDGAGDIDGDGYNDVLVADVGRVFVYWGGPLGPGSPTPLESSAPGFGCSVAGIGDIDGDRYADFAIASGCNEAGRVFVYRGGPTRTLPAPRELVHPSGAMAFGQALVHAGDVDGDGKSDLLVGAPATRAFYIYRQREIDENLLPLTPVTNIDEPDFAAFGARGAEGHEGGKWTNRTIVASRGDAMRRVPGKLFPIAAGRFSAVALDTGEDALITDVSQLSGGIITVGLRLRDGRGRVVVGGYCATNPTGIQWIRLGGEGNASFGRSIAK